MFVSRTFRTITAAAAISLGAIALTGVGTANATAGPDNPGSRTALSNPVNDVTLRIHNQSPYSVDVEHVSNTGFDSTPLASGAIEGSWPSDGDHLTVKKQGKIIIDVTLHPGQSRDYDGAVDSNSVNVSHSDKTLVFSIRYR